MRETFARALFPLSILAFAASTVFLWLGWEPFKTYFFLFAWWSCIGLADSWLYLKGGGSLMIAKPVHFFTFLVPLSAFLWFVFEAFNLRLQNWHYLNVPSETWIRWPGNFLAFGTVLPGLFLTANALEHLGVFRKNEFSQFFDRGLPRPVFTLLVTAGLAMLLIPLLFPKYFFPLVWGGFVLLLDPLNAAWNGKSLIQEWRQKNWNRTFQLLLAGLVCGFFWELWNFWAGAKWEYSVPLGWGHDSIVSPFLKELKIFEMPVLGFLGFPPFALECFVAAEFAANARERLPAGARAALAACAVLFMLLMCKMMDRFTVQSFR